MTVFRDPKAWSVDIGLWARDAGKNTAKVVRAIEISLSTKIIMKSPVDTGRFRGNWYPSVNQPTRAVNPDFEDKTGANAIARVAHFVHALGEQFHVYYIANNLPYAWPLEEGWSKQAPEGMVRTTIAEFNRVVQQEAQNVARNPRGRR